MLNILWAQERSPDDREHGVRMCRAVPMPAFAREFEERFGLRLVTTYGLSDYGTPVAFTMSDPPGKLGAAGRAMKGWDIRIVDDDDFDQPAGEIGEILLRSNTMWSEASGYYNMPQATVEAMRNGWFHTGDLGRLDGDSYLYYVGRKKDAIRRRGENISAWEVEQVIQSHPAVHEAAVYALCSDMSEDEVAVSIVLKAGAALTEEALILHCVSRMAHFMVPRYVEFQSDLPRTSTQKIEKRQLRREAEMRRHMLWDREQAGITVKR